MRKAFRSSRTFQQQLFSRTSMPSAMLATYARCDRPPPLEKLNEFRDDGRDARKFYTDPDYFFELWRREMLQDTERIQHDRGKKVRQPRSGGAEGRGARRVRVPHSTRDRQKAEAVNRGEHIMAPTQLRRSSLPPPPPPPDSSSPPPMNGIKLRKVEKRCEDNVGKYDTLRGAPALHDVASILARRVAVEQSDTDSEDESDSDNWDQWTTDSQTQKIVVQNLIQCETKSDLKVNSFKNEAKSEAIESPQLVQSNNVYNPKVDLFKNEVSEVSELTSKSPRNEVAVPLRKSSLKKQLIKCDDSPPEEPLPSPPKPVATKIVDNSIKENSPIRKEIMSPPMKNNVVSPPWSRTISPLKKEVISPPTIYPNNSSPSTSVKLNKTDSQVEENVFPLKVKRDSITARDLPKADKLSLPNYLNENISNSESHIINKVDDGKDDSKNEETNGVGDKIKIFERAAEDASANAGKLSRTGSMRRSRVERLGSDSKEEFPPPATPFKDNIFFEIGNADKTAPENPTQSKTLEKQVSLSKGTVNTAAKWQRNNSNSLDDKIIKPEPQKIIKPEFKPITSPIDLTIRSPSLVGKIPDQFPSQCTAFRNVATPDTARNHKQNDDPNSQFKTCKVKNKDKYLASVSKGSSYFTRGSEEIWLVKKKDIEEIEERVLDSFRRAGGNMCMRSESMRPSSDSGQGASFTHATMGRNKRQMYSRSESLDPQWAGNRSQTLKRQTSVACTCGHDKKTRSKSSGSGSDAVVRQRSRSHGDESKQGQVLDKYETLV
ncbi:unnamed protein product, partial [Leptidea sinapis]